MLHYTINQRWIIPAPFPAEASGVLWDGRGELSGQGDVQGGVVAALLHNVDWQEGALRLHAVVLETQKNEDEKIKHVIMQFFLLYEYNNLHL